MAIKSTQLGTGGWTPGLRTDTLSVSGKASFLASEHYTARRGGITLAAALVAADGNGDKILPAGTFVVKATSGASTGKWGIYATGATDGRQAPVNDGTSGYTFEDVNLRDGDVVCGMLIEGSVLSARVNPAPDATTKTAIAGRIVLQ